MTEQHLSFTRETFIQALDCVDPSTATAVAKGIDFPLPERLNMAIRRAFIYGCAAKERDILQDAALFIDKNGYLRFLGES